MTTTFNFIQFIRQSIFINIRFDTLKLFPSSYELFVIFFLERACFHDETDSMCRQPIFKIILCFAQKRYSIGSLAAKANMVSALQDLCKNQLTKQNL